MPFQFETRQQARIRLLFFDFIYKNTQSQGASELMCGFDVLKEQILSDEFKEVTGGKTFSKIVLFTDNALNDSCHTPFILQRNSQNKNLQIASWQNPEAQISMIVYSLLIVITKLTILKFFFSYLLC